MNLDLLSLEKLYQKDFISYIKQSTFDWHVSDQEILAFTNRKDFLETHIRNSHSHLVLTKRVMRYPISIIFSLSTIRDAYCLRRLLMFLSGDRDFHSGQFQPLQKNSEDVIEILYCLFLRFYINQFHGPVKQGHLLPDYVSMALDNGRYPNLRIKSGSRMEFEHYQFVIELNTESMSEFSIPDPEVLPKEAEGYFFTCIINRELLLAETKEIQLFVAIHPNHIISGRSVIYSISGKERATAEFDERSVGYCLAQVHTFYNKEVSETLTNLLIRITVASPKRNLNGVGPKYDFTSGEVPF